MKGYNPRPFRKANFFILFFCYFIFSGFSQSRVLDSLLRVSLQLGNDTSQAFIQNKIAWNYFLLDNYKSTLEYAAKSLNLSRELSYKPGEAEALNIMGVVYCSTGNYSKALEHFLGSLKINEQLSNKRNVSRNLMNIGIVHMYQSDYQKSLKYLFESLEINKSRNDEAGMASSLSNIALVYSYMKDYTKSLSYYEKALKITEANKNESASANTKMNIGGAYQGMGDVAWESGDKALAINRYDEALKYFEEALVSQLKLNDRSGVSHNLNSVGSILIKYKKYDKALESLQKAFSIAEEINSLELQSSLHLSLVQYYKATGQYKEAVEHLEKNYAIQDSLFSQQKIKALIQKDMQFEFEKKESLIQSTARAEKEKMQAVAIAERKKQQLIIISVCIVLFLVFIFAAIMYNRFRVTERQKNIIESQKHSLEIKNKEIHESIQYAKRLQLAILPPSDYVNRYIPDNFIYYQPKDIIAGDFYWMEVVESSEGECILIAVADSTGHGIPGALVSVVCSNALNQAVHEFKLNEPGLILDKSTEIILETFVKSNEEIKDGMDISLLAIYPGVKKVKWSGANNNLWFIDPGMPGKIKEVHANKQAVGKNDRQKPFQTHEINYKTGTVFYLFTDGFPDQFGGPRGKKFMYKPLQSLLTAISELEMTQQKSILEATFEEWKNQLEQVDDICIMGLRL
jgi:tetratricopeptide (TPR) repeat protein